MAQSAAILRQRTKKALMLAQSGQYKESIQLYLQIHRVNPNNFNAAFMLGALYGHLENYDEAARFSRLATKLDPENADALYNLAQAEMHLGNTDAAVSALQKVVELVPDHMEALNNLGYALTNQGNYDAAITRYKQVLDLQHDHVDALEALAKIYQLTGDNTRAAKLLKIALLHDPESSDLKFKLAAVHKTRGEVEESMALYDELLAQSPHTPRFAAAKAILLEKTGGFDEGFELIEPYLQDRKYIPFVAMAFAKLSRHANRREEAVHYIEDTLANSSELMRKDTFDDASEITQESTLHFELGKLYDALGDYDAAFRCYKNYNDRVKGGDRRMEETFVRIENVFTRDFLATAPVSTISTSRPIFIVGMPRSGTTLTEQILSSHPEVAGGGELSEMHTISEHLPVLLHSRLPSPECLRELTTEVVDTIARRYLARLNTISSSARHVTDKMPHNFAQIGLIRLMFPQAKIIHSIRNPLDNCLSIYFSQFNRVHNYASDLTRLGEHHSAYTRLMRHWNDLFEGEILEHRYEDVIADQEGMTRRLLDYCELDWDPACMKFFKSKRVVNTISYDQVRQPIYKKSVARWRNYEKHLGPLIASLGLDPEAL